MSDCKHEGFRCRVEVARIADGDDGPVRNYIADVTIACDQCGLPFHFIGTSAGLSFTKPTTDLVATTLHAPIAPGEAPMPARLTFEVA